MQFKMVGYEVSRSKKSGLINLFSKVETNR